jgi:hypothetical protein
MGAASRRAKKVRKAGEFDLIRLAQALQSPIRSTGFYEWNEHTIASARSAQMIGNFRLPYRLASAMKSEAAIHKALLNRLAPMRGLPIQLCAPSDTARAKRVLDEAQAQFGEQGIAISDETISDLGEQLAMHGIAFGHNVMTPRPNGSRIDIEHHAWPIEFVYWQATTKTFRAMTHAGELETIVPNNGRWAIYTNHELAPWTWGAVIPLCAVWEARGFGVRDQSRSGTSHGNAKIVGELPEGIAIDSDEGAQFLLMLESMHGPLPFGIRPHGAKTDMLVNTSQAWQIFQEIIKTASKDADGVLLGQSSDVTESSQRLTPMQLFGVRTDIVERDLAALERGFLTGVIEVWAALNFGDSTLAPYRKWLMPNAEEDARKGSLAARRQAFWQEIASAKENGVPVDQAYADKVAAAYDIDPPQITTSGLAPAGTASPAASPPSPTGAPAPQPSPPLPSDVRPLRRVP